MIQKILGIGIWTVCCLQVIILIYTFLSVYKNSSNKKNETSALIYLSIFGMVLPMLLFQFEQFGLKKYLAKLAGGHGGDWLQFWGAYLGIIFSVVMTLYITKKQANLERENSRSNHVSEIYLSTLASIDVKMNIPEFNMRSNEEIFRHIPLTEGEPFRKPSRIIELMNSIKKDDVLKTQKEIVNLTRMIPTDRKHLFSEIVFEWNKAYSEIVSIETFDNDSDNAWLFIDVEKINQQISLTRRYCEKWMFLNKCLRKVIQEELNNINFINKS